MPKRLAGTVAIVTGASAGIGKASGSRIIQIHMRTMGEALT